jgi:hypothetical protein
MTQEKLRARDEENPEAKKCVWIDGSGMNKSRRVKMKPKMKYVEDEMETERRNILVQTIYGGEDMANGEK